MTSTTVRPAAPATPSTTTSTDRPRLARRIAVGAAAFLAGALAAAWGMACLLQLLTGTEADHRFHQVTGQGLLMCALWLWPIASLARAGLRGRRPSTSAGLLHVSVVGAAVGAGALAPSGGGGGGAVQTLVTGALLWAALPLRPRLLPLGDLDVVLAPFALLTAALAAPFVVGELDLQRAMGDEHAEMAHYFDMAWVTLTLVVMAGFAAVSAAARRLAVPAGAGLALVGASRFVFTDDVTWSLLAVLLGLAGAVAGARRSAA